MIKLSETSSIKYIKIRKKKQVKNFFQIQVIIYNYIKIIFTEINKIFLTNTYLGQSNLDTFKLMIW